MGDYGAPNGVTGHPRVLSRRLINGRLADEYYQPLPPNSLAPCSGSEKLEVAIIGAGIAGLSAAIALTQSGHNVELYEKSKFGNEIGAAINMCPNASRILSYFEFNFARGMPTPVDELIFRDAYSLEVLLDAVTPDYEPLYAAPWLLFHRVDLHNELKRMATEPRPSTQAVAKINLLSEVTDIDLEGNIVLANGQRLQKDLVVVADGVRSKFVAKVAGSHDSLKPLPTGTAVYRFLIPTGKLLADEQTQHLFEKEKFVMQLAPYSDGRLVWYPCRRGALQNFGFFHPDRIQGFEDEVWNIPASREEFMKVCSPLHPDLQAVCSKAEDLKLWRLCARERPIRTLTKGKAVLIGDAAHPMLPHQGQGGGMAVEDGAALGALFSNLCSKNEIYDRLKLFQNLRLDRVSALQIISSVGQDQVGQTHDQVRPFIKGPLPKTPEDCHAHNFTPNIIRDALELLREYQAGLSGSRL